jgi:RNA polymerase sigma-70 factor (ECF subfamily)
MLGSQTDADDAVQETFLRAMRAGRSGVDNFAGWLTTIVARVCLDMLRGRRSRREVSVDAEVEALPAADNLEREELIADSVGVAMLVVLETLTPAERVAFVLHDMFNISFDEIGPVIGRASTAARQLASRAPTGPGCTRQAGGRPGAATRSRWRVSRCIAERRLFRSPRDP